MRQDGLIYACTLTASPKPSKGVITKTMGLALEFAPALIIQKEEIDYALQVIEECLTEEEKTLGL